MTAGTSTSVDITQGYLERIRALSIDGPSLNAVRVVNPAAVGEAAAADARRRAGEKGPLLGIPVLLKDNIDVKGLPNTAGSVALAGNVSPADAPLVTTLRAAGAVILGKTNLTEFANFLTSGMPAGYSSLGGQVLNAYDASQTPSGSSAGSGVAASVGLAPLTIGTETSGSILSPANANSLVGIKPTVGLVPRTGIIPIAASQDTAGPMVKTVADAAALLNGITSRDAADPATASNPLAGHDFLADLSTTALQGARIGVVGDPAAGTPTDSSVLFLQALDALRGQGASVTVGLTLPPAPATTPVPAGTASTLVYEFKRDLNDYLSKRTAADFPIRSLADVIAYNDAHAAEALKFGQVLALQSQRTDTAADAPNAALRRQADLANSKGRLDPLFANGTPADPSDDYDALVYANNGSAGIGAQAGYPTVLVPSGYQTGQSTAPGGDPSGNRRPVSLSFLGQAYDEPVLLGLASDYEAATQLRRPPSALNPSLFRCTGLPGSSSTGCVTGATTPGAPTGVTAVPGDRSLTVSFTPPADSGGAPVTSYTVSATPTAGLVVTASVPATATSTVLSGLTNGTPYVVTVSATTVGGTSPQSLPVTARPGAPTTPPAPPSCTPAALVRLERTTVIATGSSGVTVTAPASSTVDLYAYTRPSSTYRVVRTGITSATGTVTFDALRPPANTRLYAQVRGCTADTVRDSVVLNVRTALSLFATRTGKQTYRFSGDSLPARPGGLVVSLYRVTASGGQVLTAQTRASATTGDWALTRRFTGTGRFGFVVRTGQDLQNAPGASNVRPTLLY